MTDTLPKLRVQRNWMDALINPRGPKWEVGAGSFTYASFMTWRDAYDWARAFAEQITARLDPKEDS